MWALMLKTGYRYNMKCLAAVVYLLTLEASQVDTLPSPIASWISSAEGARLTRQSRDVPWKSASSFAASAKNSTKTMVLVDTDHTGQTMRGFGASFLESGAMNLNTLPLDKQVELLDLLFSDSGARFSAMKAPIPCNDFCAAGPWYTYDDSPGDVHLVNFSIARDLRPNGTLTFIKRARAHGFDGVLQSYMDYPPDWMMKGKQPNRSTVDPKYYPALAQYYAKFVEAYAEQGAIINYLSLFNEPIDSYTKISDPAMATLLGDHVGPLFDKLGLRPRTKLTYGGQATRLWASMHIPAIMQNPNAKKYMDHFAYHGYDCQFNCTRERQQYGKIIEIHRQWPEQEIFLAEICYAYNGDDPNCSSASTLQNCTDWPRNHSLAPPLPRVDFEDGRIWGSRIVSDIQAGASGWIYWNLILDMKGGPFQYSPRHNDGSQNLQQAVIHVDSDAEDFHPTALFWYLAHFSRFVRPGAVRAAVTVQGNIPNPLAPEGTSGVEAVVFVDRNIGQVTLQLLNHENKTQDVEVAFNGYTASLTLPAVSIISAQWSFATSSRESLLV